MPARTLYGCRAVSVRIDIAQMFQDLLKQLEEAYARRDQLWIDFERALDETSKHIVAFLMIISDFFTS